ncbi:hypothetical protein RHPLAN_56850 [Rhodoplanes sp. Z2-YC6860]|nr:hypothetical protein RHPLAN_56850 [Rhodoplanes sp. Z2-YC6860]
MAKKRKQTPGAANRTVHALASGQRYEVSYEAKKTGRNAKSVKRAVKKVGNSRKKVERRLAAMSFYTSPLISRV